VKEVSFEFCVKECIAGVMDNKTGERKEDETEQCEDGGD